MSTFNRVYAAIDLDAIKFNLTSMHHILNPDTKIIAVVKTDGYGHGAVTIAQYIEDMSCIYGFATATAEEACELREAGISKPILILGYVFPDDYESVIRNEISATVFSMESAYSLSNEAVKQDKSVSIHIKIDTGMSRIGFQVTETSADEIAEISKLPGLVLDGLFTHFSRADEKDKTESQCQMEHFKKMEQMLQMRNVNFPFRHISNSAGILELPNSDVNLVRAGIAMYGLWPSDEVDQLTCPLMPAMSIKSHIVHIKELESGRSISYGGTYTLTQQETIATVPVGYGDGYPRSLSNIGYVLIHGQKAPIRGRICMDQFMVDISGIQDVWIGDEITLLGRDGEHAITMEELARMSDRFNYELACDINKRVPRVYYHHDQKPDQQM
ncbi:MAG: alanine racemase [Lachnospiraceae bacterium]